MSGNYTGYLMGCGLPDPLVIPGNNPQPRGVLAVVIKLKKVGEE
jgi:hypothetical protein